MNTFSGPMFMPAVDQYRRSTSGKEGSHYNTYGTESPDKGMALLRDWFGKPKSMNAMNLVLFSTSGVHGMYTTIEEVERDIRKYGPDGCGVEDCSHNDGWHPREVTFLLIQPRIVSMTYGNASCRTLDDAKFLKRLRRESWAAVQRIGK